MRVVTIILIVVALGVAGVTAFLVNQFLAETEAEAQKPVEVVEEPKVEVLVAAVDLPVGKILRSEDMRWQQWPEDSIGPDYIVRGMTAEPAETEGEDEAQAVETIGDVEGAAVRIELVAGEPILSSKLFHRGDSGFLSGVLAPGMRAITVSVNPETGSAGFVLPGDRVDIVVIFDVLETDDITGDTTSRTVSETILENIRVLATDQSVAARAETGEDDGAETETLADLAETVTLEVSPNQAQAVSVADALGNIRLILRSAIEGELSEDRLRYSPDYAVSEFLGRSVPHSARVLVAGHDLAPGTVLTDRDWIWLEMPADLIEPGWTLLGSVDINLLRSAYLPDGLEAGDPIVVEDLILPGQDAYITSLLNDGMRAVTIVLDEARSVSGFVAPGDRVDIVFNYEATIDYGDEEPFFIKDPRRFSEVLLEDVRVLHIDREFDPATGLPQIVAGTATVTLEVTPEQAEAVILATNEGTLSLLLRGESPGEESRLADYTTDFEFNRSYVDLAYGKTLPPPPGSATTEPAVTDGAATDQTDGTLAEELGSDQVIDLNDYLDGLGADVGNASTGGSGGLSGQVRVYRSTVPQDLDFSR